MEHVASQVFGLIRTCTKPDNLDPQLVQMKEILLLCTIHLLLQEDDDLASLSMEVLLCIAVPKNNY